MMYVCTFSADTMRPTRMSRREISTGLSGALPPPFPEAVDLASGKQQTKGRINHQYSSK